VGIVSEIALFIQNTSGRTELNTGKLLEIVEEINSPLLRSFE
jgi:hypothetical protein